MNKEPFLSVITPCYRRGIFLPNVWRSLLCQSVNLEWIVGIDGRNDDASIIVAQLGNLRLLNITVILFSDHVGKSVVDNAMIAHARGKYIVWCDSDDYFGNNGLDRACQKLARFGALEDPSILGCVCRIADFQFRANESIQNDSAELITFSDLWKKTSNFGDCSIIFKSSVLVANPFPEVDFYYPEGVIWKRLGDMKIICSNLPIRFGTNQSDGISRSQIIRYPRSKALNLQELLREASTDGSPALQKLVYAMNFFRFSWHSNRPRNAVRILMSDFKLLSAPAIIFGLLLLIRDYVKNNIEKTHREFDKSNKRPSQILHFTKM